AAAGRKYQALLVISQLMEMAVALHAVEEYADAVKEPSLILVQTTETFGNQVKPLLESALSEDPRRIERALRERPELFTEWMKYLARWTTHVQADARRMEVAKQVWDITIGAVAAYEAAGELAEIVSAGGPRMPPLAAFGMVGGEVSAVGMSRLASIELAEAVRKLIASGALDAGVVAALSATVGGASGASPAPPAISQMSAEHAKGSLQGLGNVGGHGEPIDAQTALKAGARWLGPGYKEIAPGVFRSADGLRQFRMTNADVAPAEGASHVHFEALDEAGHVVENLHLPIKG
ncbi:MAG TPA: hypothetical protein VND93_28830, partial [Myxococcales bacterium]|nr:hypothetical protein [Myxococcales bacterium]